MDIKQLLKDDDFISLPEKDKKQVLHEFLLKDDDYKGLPGKDQRDFLNETLSVKQDKPKESVEPYNPDDMSTHLSGNLKALPGAIETAAGGIPEQNRHEMTLEEKRAMPNVFESPKFDPGQLSQNMAAKYNSLTPEQKAQVEAKIKRQKQRRGFVEAVKGGAEQSATGTLVRNKISEYEPETTLESLTSGVTSALTDTPIYLVGGAIGSGWGPVGSAAGAFGLHSAVKSMADSRARGDYNDVDSIEGQKKALFATADAGVEGLKGAVTGLLVHGAGTLASKAALATGSKVYNGALEEALSRGLRGRAAVEYATKQAIPAMKAIGASKLPLEAVAMSSSSVLSGENPLDPENLAKSMTELAILKVFNKGMSTGFQSMKKTGAFVNDRLSRGTSKKEALQEVVAAVKNPDAPPEIKEIREELAQEVQREQGPPLTEAKSEYRPMTPAATKVFNQAIKKGQSQGMDNAAALDYAHAQAERSMVRAEKRAASREEAYKVESTEKVAGDEIKNFPKNVDPRKPYVEEHVERVPKQFQHIKYSGNPQTNEKLTQTVDEIYGDAVKNTGSDVIMRAVSENDFGIVEMDMGLAIKKGLTEKQFNTVREGVIRKLKHEYGDPKTEKRLFREEVIPREIENDVMPAAPIKGVKPREVKNAEVKLPKIDGTKKNYQAEKVPPPMGAKKAVVKGPVVEMTVTGADGIKKKVLTRLPDEYLDKEAQKVLDIRREREQKPMELNDLETSFGAWGKDHKDETDRVRKFIMTDPQVYHEIIKTADKMESRPLEYYTKNVSRQIENSFGTPMKRMVVDSLRAVEHNYVVENKSVQESIKAFEKEAKSYSKKTPERLGAWLIAQQENGKETLIKMEVEVPTLTEKEMKFADKIKDDLAKMFNRVNAARNVAGLAPIEGVKNYFTFLRKFSIAEELGFNPMVMPKEMWDKLDVHPKSFTFGFGKERVKSDRSVELDAFHVLGRYNQAALRTVHMTPVIGKLQRIFEATEFEKQDPVGYQYMQKTLDYIAGMKQASNVPAVINKTASIINKNVGAFILSYNIDSAFIQPTAIVNTLAKIGPKYAAEGVAGIMSPSMRKFAVAKSKVLLGRIHDISVDEMKKGFYGTYGKVRGKAIDVGTYPLRLLDYNTAMASWIGSYKHAVKYLKMDEKGAARFADDTVVKTQGSASRIDLAPIQRTPIGKSATLFQTFVINNWNFLLDDIIKNKNLSYAERSKQLAGILVAGGLSNTLIRMTGDTVPIFSGNTPFPSPLYAFYKEYSESEDGAKALKESGREMLSIVPVLGGGARFGGRAAFGAAGQLGFDVFDMAAGKGNKSPLYLGAKIAGAPGGQQIYKWLKKWEAYQKEQNKKPEPINVPTAASIREQIRRDVLKGE